MDYEVRTRLCCAANGCGYGKLHSTAPPPSHEVCGPHLYLLHLSPNLAGMGNSARGRPSVTLQSNWLTEKDEADVQPPLRARVGRAAAAATSPERQLDAVKLLLMAL